MNWPHSQLLDQIFLHLVGSPKYLGSMSEPHLLPEALYVRLGLKPYRSDSSLSHFFLKRLTHGTAYPYPPTPVYNSEVGDEEILSLTIQGSVVNRRSHAVCEEESYRNVILENLTVNPSLSGPIRKAECHVSTHGLLTLLMNSFHETREPPN